MKIVAIVIASLLVAFFIGAPIERAVNDTDPVSTDGAMIPVDLPTPTLPLASDDGPAILDPEQSPSDEVLSLKLVTVSKSEVQVPMGRVQLNAGVPVTLVRDRGPQVDVTWQGTKVSLPREFVRNAESTRAPSSVKTLAPTPPRPVASAADKILKAPVDRVGVSAHEIGTSKGIDRTWTTDYGSYDKDQYRSKALEVEIRNVSRRGTGDCEVMAYWMGRRVSDRAMLIHHAEQIPTNVGAASVARVRFWCPLIAANETRYVSLGIREVDGAKIDGWFVLVSRGGHTLGGVASSPTYERLLQSPDQLAPLLASYKPSGRKATTAMPQWRNDPLRESWSNRRSTPTPAK